MTRRQKLTIPSVVLVIAGFVTVGAPAAAAPSGCPAVYSDVEGMVRGALLPGEEHWFLHIFQHDFLNPSSGVTYDVLGHGGGWAELAVFEYGSCAAPAECSGTYAAAVFAGPMSAGSCTTGPASHWVRVIWHDNNDEDSPVDYVLRVSQKVRALS